VVQKTSASTSKQHGIIRFPSGSGCLDFLRALSDYFSPHSQLAGLFVADIDLFVAFFRISDILTSPHWLLHWA
jgi:hypothetical protein